MPASAAFFMVVTPFGRYALVSWCVVVAGAIGHMARRELAARRPLRRCPRCRSVAVRQSLVGALDRSSTQVAVECGQCSAWRRLTTTPAVAERHVRQVKRDRHAISHRAAALTLQRHRREFDAFAELLRSRVLGADDFLALTGGLRRSAASQPEQRDSRER